jgi:hypothetical protein
MGIKTELPGGIKLSIDTVDEYIELMTKLKGAYKRPQVKITKVVSPKTKQRSVKNNCYSRWSKEDILEVKELYMKGYRIKQIAKRFGRTKAAIASQIAVRGYLRRPKGL